MMHTQFPLVYLIYIKEKEEKGKQKLYIKIQNVDYLFLTKHTAYQI